MNILEDLWYGNIAPMERLDYRTEEYRHLLQLQEKNEERLLPTLNTMQKEDLQKLRNVESEMEEIVQCAAFLAGFRLAAQILSASLLTPS